MVVALSFAYLASGYSAAPVADETSLPYQVLAVTELKQGAGGHYYVKAQINGRTINAVVDTGATAVAMSYEDADRAGLRPRSLTYNMPVGTANGMVKAAEVDLSKVEVDGVRVNNVRGLVMPKGALNITLLGMSYLSKLRSFSVSDGVLTLKN
jgi:aspartyl protease family protein